MNGRGLFDPIVCAGSWRPEVQACYSRTWERYDMPPHFHNRMEIMYVLKGWCRVHLFDYRADAQARDLPVARRRTERLGAGEFIFLDQGVLHQLEVPETNYMMNVEFTLIEDAAAPVAVGRLASSAPELQAMIRRGRRVMRGKDESGQLMRIMEQAILGFSSVAPRDPALENVLMAELLLRVAGGVKDNAMRGNALSYARRAADYLAAHLDEEVRVADVARATGVAGAYLQRVFRQATGMTMVEYLNRLRVEQSKQLLMNTDESILDVAVASGFNSRQHFFRVFRAATGLSPRQFRREQRTRQARQLFVFDRVDDRVREGWDDPG